MQEHIRCIKKGEIHNHYLGHNIQNEFIQMLAIQIKNTIINNMKKENISQLFLIVLQIQAIKNKCLLYSYPRDISFWSFRTYLLIISFFNEAMKIFTK